jgi:Glycosyl transferase family group 2
MRHLQHLDSRVLISILTDEGQEASFHNINANILGTPRSFRPRRALFKARALEWFRLYMRLEDTDWVLHLDEETIVDDHTIRTCINFAELQGDYDYGQASISITLSGLGLTASQGIILYNAFRFWHHKLITFADVVRARDDLGKFYLSHYYLNVPVFGIHGSFLFINGKLENEVGWDTDSLVEDFWFSLQVGTASKTRFLR